MSLHRRQFVATAVAGGVCWAGSSSPAASDESNSGDGAGRAFEISLAQWSLHRTLRDPKSGMTNLDFPSVARQQFEIDAIEYVNQFWKDKASDTTYLQQLQTRCDDAGVKSLLIMVDGEGQLGDPDRKARRRAINNHRPWLDAAAALGCHSIRVNAASRGNHGEQSRLAADGLRRLSEIAAPMQLNVLVENHGGWSSHAGWLAQTIKRVGMDNCGTLPDFGNFHLTRGEGGLEFNRYQGVKQLMPMAKAVSAKSHDFDDDGGERHTDYAKMMKIVREAGYRGHVGIEYEGDKLTEAEGILKTRDLLRRFQTQV